MTDWALNAALLFGLALLASASLLVGPALLSPGEVIRAVTASGASPEAVIVQEIRLPRTILGGLVGAALGLSGAALQGLLRNPLAEPGLVGVSGSAAFGAALVFYFGLATAFPFALPLAGMAGALVAVAALYFLAGRAGSMLTLILAGVAISSFAGALTALALNLAPSPYAALEIAFWLLGSLADRSFVHVGLVLPLVLLGAIALMTTGRGLDALALGEDQARSLGIDLDALRLRVVIGVALAVGSVVSVTGAVAFVGLVVPHILRPLVGHEPARLLLPSALGGAALVLLADAAARAISTTVELKLGVVTALVGAPFFFYLVLRARGAGP